MLSDNSLGDTKMVAKTRMTSTKRNSSLAAAHSRRTRLGRRFGRELEKLSRREMAGRKSTECEEERWRRLGGNNSRRVVTIVTTARPLVAVPFFDHRVCPSVRPFVYPSTLAVSRLLFSARLRDRSSDFPARKSRKNKEYHK